jgi:hypothetical protein
VPRRRKTGGAPEGIWVVVLGSGPDEAEAGPAAFWALTALLTLRQKQTHKTRARRPERLPTTMATIVPSGRVNGGSASMIGRAAMMVLLTQSKNAEEARVEGSGVESLQSSPAVELRGATAYELL